MSKIPPAYYGGWHDWWTLLHPPYTLMHLSFVVIGAALAPELNLQVLVATLLAFFLAVGVAAHALDEIAGRPLATTIPTTVLVALTVIGLLAAVSIGVIGAIVKDRQILWFVFAGIFLVTSYNLELFDGYFHTNVWFALAWGAFPVLTANFAQTGYISIIGLLGAIYAFTMSLTQRHLSTPARRLRRKVDSVEGTIFNQDGSTVPIDRRLLLKPLERALQLLVLSNLAMALTLLLLRVLGGYWVVGL